MLSTKLEVMVRQAAGVERTQAMIRAVDTASAAKFLGEWKVFKVESENERRAEEAQKNKGAARPCSFVFLAYPIPTNLHKEILR